jgi:hypothetical protein
MAEDKFIDACLVRRFLETAP